MSIESLVRHLGVVEDPRCQGKIEHHLIDILVIAVCAGIARRAQTQRFHLRPWGVGQNEAVHPELESQPSLDENP